MQTNAHHSLEEWKIIVFNFEYTNDCRIEVSNYGRVRTFNVVSEGNILNGSMINGYKIIRLKFYEPRTPAKAAYFQTLQQQAVKLQRDIKALKEQPGSEKKVQETSALLVGFRKDLSKKFQQDLKARTINYHALVHRLVAEYFCTRPSEEHSVVGHLDHNKLNNKWTNIRWMKPEENWAHQQKSPHVIEKKKRALDYGNADSRVNKLTITRVMLLKKLLREGKPIKTLVKQFKITDTQIRRIQRGENWGYVEAAK
jgi:hypothetical protein